MDSAGAESRAPALGREASPHPMAAPIMITRRAATRLSSRSWTPESVTRAVTAPRSAICMSHCVSHTSPWVPRKASAASPVASAVQNSISS